MCHLMPGLASTPSTHAMAQNGSPAARHEHFGPSQKPVCAQDFDHQLTATLCILFQRSQGLLLPETTLDLLHDLCKQDLHNQMHACMT